MRGFKWSSNQKRHLTAIVACPQQQSMSNKPWMIKKINWRALSDTDHVYRGGSYVTLTPCLLIVRDLPWNKVLCGSASIETITPMKESRVNISWCISFSDFQNRIQKKRISRKNVNRVFFLKKWIIKTLSTNVRRINSERYFTGYGRVTPQPGVLPGGGNVGHFFQSLHSRKPVQESVNLNSSPVYFLGDTERQATFLISLDLFALSANGKVTVSTSIHWEVLGTWSFRSVSDIFNQKVRVRDIHSTRNTPCTKIKGTAHRSSVPERTNTLLQFPFLLLPCFVCASPTLLNSLCALHFLGEKK